MLVVLPNPVISRGSGSQAGSWPDIRAGRQDRSPDGPRRASGSDQLSVTAVSSMKNDVATELSSVPVHFSATVEPAYDVRVRVRLT